jgi:hypothetical protein
MTPYGKDYWITVKQIAERYSAQSIYSLREEAMKDPCSNDKVSRVS